MTESGDERTAFDRMAGLASPLGRSATAQEAAGEIAFLLSDAAATTMTSAALVLDGDYTL